MARKRIRDDASDGVDQDRMTMYSARSKCPIFVFTSPNISCSEIISKIVLVIYNAILIHERGSFKSCWSTVASTDTPTRNSGICKASLLRITYDGSKYCTRSVEVFTYCPHRHTHRLIVSLVATLTTTLIAFAKLRSETTIISPQAEIYLSNGRPSFPNPEPVCSLIGWRKLIIVRSKALRLFG